MKTTVLSFAALVAASLLPAQDKAPAQAPNPKTKAHEALAMLAGDWQIHCKMAAVPGVPGMEKAQESTGTEHVELICNGLWVKSTIDSTHQGKPFQGIWLVGYDPFAKTYKSIWASSMDEPACEAVVTWDEKTKTWTSTGKAPTGEAVRSQYVFKDNDNSIETCWMTGADGKEVECMQMMRKRGKGAMARDASASSDMPVAKELALLAQGVGNWTAKVTMTMPGQPASEETCTEQVAKICNGKWTWSNFKGSMMGMPFEGHALCGYDNIAKKYVTYWLDSCCATASRVEGSLDEAKRQFTFSGSCVDPQGKPMTIKQIYSQPDADTRSLHMTSTGAEGAHEMKIAYTRVKG
ncbi:MAG TPA: DUF1579 family protein [Planctomycetota bacterium]